MPGYDFSTKVRLDALVISEIAAIRFPNADGIKLCEARNAVAIAMSDSEQLHGLIEELAYAIKAEADRQNGL